MSSSRGSGGQSKKRKISNTVTSYDYDELKKNYTFLPEENRRPQSWQDRMVLQYHSHLFKDYVLADTTRVASHRQIGLRWRTEKEVRCGRGSSSCGNLQCPSQAQGTPVPDAKEEDESPPVLYMNSEEPSNEALEIKLLSTLRFGSLLTEYEVPFTYKERNEKKTELVKLSLCVRCAPLLFVSKGDKTPSLSARRKRRFIEDDSKGSAVVLDPSIKKEGKLDKNRKLDLDNASSDELESRSHHRSHANEY